MIGSGAFVHPLIGLVLKEGDTAVWYMWRDKNEDCGVRLLMMRIMKRSGETIACARHVDTFGLPFFENSTLPPLCQKRISSRLCSADLNVLDMSTSPCPCRYSCTGRSNSCDNGPANNALCKVWCLCKQASGASVFSAVGAFNRIKEPTLYTWNAIILAHVQHGEERKALGHFGRMQKVSVVPDVATYLSLLKACAGLRDLARGRAIHRQFLKHALKSNAFENSLIDMYAKCSSIEDARCVFERLASRSIVSWGALIAGCVENNDTFAAFKLYEQMKETGVKPNRVIFLCFVKACICLGSLSRGMLVHDELIKGGFDSDLIVANSIMDSYVKLHSLDEALKVFDNLPCPDIVSWATRIAGLADNGHNVFALECYEKMLSKGLTPDKYTYSSVLKACAGESSVMQGRWVHDQVLRCGLDSNIVVANALIDMYGKCAFVQEACKVFQNITNHDVVSWSTVIARCVDHGFDALALHYFENMQQCQVRPNKALFLCALKACLLAGNLVLGRIIHDQIIRHYLEFDVAIGSTLVNMYGNHGSLEEAGFVLNLLEESNEVTWGLMIAACVQHNNFTLALGLLIKMLSKQMHVDNAALIGILKGCSKSGDIVCGRLLHSLLLESGCGHAEVKSALIDMYTKCGSYSDSSKLSDGFLPGANIAFWDVRVASMVRSGRFETVHHCVQTMFKNSVQPDRVFFLGLVSACSSAGVLEKCFDYFVSMRNDFGVEPGIDEYNVMADLLGRMGFSGEGEALLLSMPFCPDLVSWMSLLSCSKSLLGIALARRSFDEVVQRDPNEASGYVLMANIYADEHMLKDLMDMSKQCCQADLSKEVST